jgi:hypothetical protein
MTHNDIIEIIILSKFKNTEGKITIKKINNLIIHNFYQIVYKYELPILMSNEQPHWIEEYIEVEISKIQEVLLSLRNNKLDKLLN